ncbi:hypothetical protein K504DRAFT_405554 [Pleomassaria siparia CBS 279.74]|uniref:P-loop containing nucleoside triphosphate hydrolase protein n=1 Tax=Pleomassaria siparia CBS 279.74 TaxID=1314801 RepID=A0A6G1KDA4_9PLEO|nr:hypothetical protein K504DRAFT_405554 [Pleomassaria siparia CBS 279.74]
MPTQKSNAAGSEASGTPFYTPSATPAIVFGEERVASTPFVFGPDARQPEALPMSSPSYKPSVSPSIISGEECGASAPFVCGPSSARHSETRSVSCPVSTPSATPSIAFSEEHVPSPSFLFDRSGASLPTTPTQRTSSHNDTASNTPRYTPPVTPPFPFGEQRTSSPAFTFRLDVHPDTPLPSVELDQSVTATSGESSPSSMAHTSSSWALASIVDQKSEQADLTQDIQNLRLNSATPVATGAVNSHQRPSHHRNTSSTTSTPSIHITPMPTVVDSGEPAREDSLVRGIDALRMDKDHRSLQSSDTEQFLRTESPAISGSRETASRSVSPSRRRRSGSNTGATTHQVEDETPPQALVRERELQAALRNARSVTTRMAEILSSSRLHEERDSSIGSLHQQAINLSKFQPPSLRIVGLVGDSGVGKSSLINSLLDKQGLARASNSGAACTCVVTEYHYHEQDAFIIQVEYFTLDQLRSQLDELLHAYRDYEALTPNTNITDKEREALKKKANLASSTFSASFKRRIAQIPGILLSFPFDQALETMIGWASETLRRQETMPERFERITQFSSRLSQLTSETDDASQTSFWPFIQKIRVYLKAHILSKGLVIADLPGLRDLNSARQNVTERYVRQCHQIFAVANIGRATTDQGVVEVLELARHARINNVGVVCTKSDEIIANEARNDWPAERSRIDALLLKYDNAKEQVEGLMADIEEFGSDVDDLCEEDRQDLFELQQELRRAEKTMNDAGFEIQRHIITVRNQKVTRGLRKQYGNNTNLNVFCVSNKLYWDVRQKSVQVSMPSIQTSGIIDLRRHCISIVADSHIRAAKEYIQEEIPAFLGSVQLWVEAGAGNGSAERKQQILEAMSAVDQELDKLTSPVSRINSISHSVNSKFDNQIGAYMRDRAARWGAGAHDASRDWQQWHHASFSAFCRNYGEHYTRTIGSKCWNGEAMSTMKEDLYSQWVNLERSLPAYLEQTNVFIESCFIRVINTLKKIPNADDGARAGIRTLIATFRHRRHLLSYDFENITDDFRAQISAVQTDALSPIRTSIIGTLMENKYKRANREYGSGSDRRRKDIITDGFSSPALFNDHRRRFKERFVHVSNELETKIRNAIAAQLAFVATDLNTMRDQNVVLESERNPEFRTQLAAELVLVEDDMGEIRRSIEGIVPGVRKRVG